MAEWQAETLLDTDEDRIRPSVSLLAVVTLGLGLLSLATPLHQVLWIVPVLALVTGGMALRRIADYWPGLVGRPLVWIGLALALFGGAIAPARELTRYLLAEAEAAKVADAFFAELRDNQPQRAYELTLQPQLRLPADDHLWAKYRSSNELLESLKKFIDEPVIRALLELGSKAEVRFYRNELYSRMVRREALINVYAVRYREDDGTLKSFFVRLFLIRHRDDNDQVGWYVQASGPISAENVNGETVLESNTNAAASPAASATP